MEKLRKAIFIDAENKQIKEITLEKSEWLDNLKIEYLHCSTAEILPVREKVKMLVDENAKINPKTVIKGRFSFNGYSIINNAVLIQFTHAGNVGSLKSMTIGEVKAFVKF